MQRLLLVGSAFVGLFAAASSGFAGNAERDEFYRSMQRYQPGGGPSGGDSSNAGSGGNPTALLVSGVIGPGSYDEFRAALSRETPVLVVIDGPGGVLGEAILIGEEIRRRRLDTLVGPNHSCASACAVVFLSGHTRYLGSGAVVGLHSASYADGRSDPEATALMAAYLSEVGVPGPTLTRMAHTAPSAIRWLTKAEQRAIGIRLYRAPK